LALIPAEPVESRKIALPLIVLATLIIDELNFLSPTRFPFFAADLRLNLSLIFEKETPEYLEILGKLLAEIGFTKELLIQILPLLESNTIRGLEKGLTSPSPSVAAMAAPPTAAQASALTGSGAAGLFTTTSADQHTAAAASITGLSC